MRSIIIIFCFCSLQVMALDTLSVKSKIEGVTVFLSGAQIERTAKVNVSKGKNVIVLEELSPEISSNSIQIKPGQGTLLGVEFGINYLKELPASNQLVKAYRDSLFDFELEKQINDGILETYAEEKKLLQENREIKLNERTLFLEDLEDMADFFRKRMSEINLKLMELKRTDNNLKKKIERLKRQLAQVNQPKTKPSGEITLALLSDVAGTVDIQIKYFVNQAGWKPFYDVRVNDVSKPLTLDYRAKVWQKSGIDWKNVKLVLSTSNPNKNNDRPVIRPWKLYLQNNTYAWQYGDVSKATRSRESDKKAYFAAEAESGVKLDGDFNTAADFTSLSESQTSYEFNIDLKYNVPSNGKEHDIYIQKNSIKADYQYYVAPRYRQEAFLIAKMVDWGRLNLLDGHANIYLDGVFKGISYINTRSTNDTLDFSLGIDESVIVIREKVDEFCESKVLGSNKKETLGYKIKVRNSKSAAISVMIQDQIPISTNKEIEIELLESSSAKYEESTGYLSWKHEIPANQTKEILFKYEVKYPKSGSINL